MIFYTFTHFQLTFAFIPTGFCGYVDLPLDAGCRVLLLLIFVHACALISKLIKYAATSAVLRISLLLLVC